MSFEWTDGPAINKPTNILQGAMGARRICGRVETLKYLQEVRAWASEKSRTAQRLLKTVDESDVTIYLVGMDGGFTCFDSDPQPNGTVYMNLNLELSLRPGGSSGAHAGFERLHPYVAFLHEVGHAVQYIENPSQFSESAKGPLFRLKSDIENAARAYGERNFGNLPYSQRRVWFSPNGPVAGQAWAVRLEYDNVYRHERPICQEAGEPMRDHYNDIQISAN